MMKSQFRRTAYNVMKFYDFEEETIRTGSDEENDILWEGKDAHHVNELMLMLWHGVSQIPWSPDKKSFNLLVTDKVFEDITNAIKADALPIPMTDQQKLELALVMLDAAKQRRQGFLIYYTTEW